MNNILEQIKKVINDSIKEYMPEVKPENLEENGAIYYMNAQNGTEWDYYVNEHLSYFMVFYNDKENLGAVKLSLYTDGYYTLYLYNEKGKNLLKTIDSKIDVVENDVLKFATLLKVQMDDKDNWDANIEKIDMSKESSEEEINDFKNAKGDFERTKNRFRLFPKIAYVSRKILDEGYKVGYMIREEPLNNNDSGWQFLAGNEDDEYLKNNKNLALLSINEINNLDSDIFKYLDCPVGSEFIRISSNEFEEDRKDKLVFIEKRGKKEE